MVINNNNITKIQKNRFKQNPKTIKKNKFGDFGFVSKNEGRIELVQISFMKKNMKKLIRKKKSESDVIREKIWYFGRPNFLIQKKSKNSRMGKGKGMIERKIIRIRKNFTMFEFKGIPLLKLKKLIKKINKVLNIKFFLNSNYSKTFSLWSKKNKFILYHEKYLFQ